MDGTWVCVKATFPALRAKWKHKWATLSIGDKTHEIPPNPGNCRFTTSNYGNAQKGLFYSLNWIFNSWENSTEIQPVNLACANSGTRLHVSGSATSCWALNMDPVTLHSMETHSEGAHWPPWSCRTPSAPKLDFHKGPWKCCDGGTGSTRCPGRKYQIEKHLSTTLVSSLLFRHLPVVGFRLLNICSTIRSLGTHNHFTACFELKKKCNCRL